MTPLGNANYFPHGFYFPRRSGIASADVSGLSGKNRHVVFALSSGIVTAPCQYFDVVPARYSDRLRQRAQWSTRQPHQQRERQHRCHDERRASSLPFQVHHRGAPSSRAPSQYQFVALCWGFSCMVLCRSASLRRAKSNETSCRALQKFADPLSEQPAKAFGPNTPQKALRRSLDARFGQRRIRSAASKNPAPAPFKHSTTCSCRRSNGGL